MPRSSSNHAKAGLFPYRELRYYSFGLRTGFANLLRNGLRLGWKRTAGKITQPVNSYTRFPEYHYFDQAISTYLAERGSDSSAAILDVGSPKLMGLYLAFNEEVDMILTDITELNIDQYRILWDGIRSKARGQANFALHDARYLSFPTDQFDVVYSMSVIEHVQGELGDAQAVSEMVRVLKPGGLLVISVPFGPTYQEQSIIGFAGAARFTDDRKEYFFQRIYGAQEFTNRVLAGAELQDVSMTTIWRRRTPLIQAYSRLGQNIHGALGILNPFLSALVNRSCSGMNSSFHGCYGRLHSLQDIYGDLILTGIKPG